MTPTNESIHGDGSVEMTTGDPKEARRLLYQKLGWCLVRIQQIELGMKWLASHTGFESPAGELTEHLERHEMRIAKQTLGSVTEVVNVGLLKPLDWEPPAEDTEEPAGSRIRVGMSIGLEDDHAEFVRERLKDLVSRRNLLVHELIPRHDIWTDDGCASATSFVEETTDLADLVLKEIDGWISELAGLGQALASLHTQNRAYGDVNRG